MPLKILTIGLPTENAGVTSVESAEEAPSLFDFEIVIADIDSVLPNWCKSKCPVDEYLNAKEEDYDQLKKLIDRLKKEVSLLLEKGGILVCIMKPKRGLGYGFFDRFRMSQRTLFLNNYDWIPIEDLDFRVAYGSGKGIEVCNSGNVFNKYLQMNETFWTAYFENIDNSGSEHKTVGLNDAKKPVAIEFNVEKGVIIFLPCSTHPNVGDILLSSAIRFFRKAEEVPPPIWIKEITVPNEVTDLTQLVKLKGEISKLQNTFDGLDGKLRKESRIKKLLYEKDTALEEIVRESFEELGFACKKKGDKDWMISSEMGEGILEVTGSEGSIDITKFRQLLNYLLDETKETGDEMKAILVANHFSDLPIEKRGAPFTEKAIDGSKLHSICLLPTSELFKLICDLRLGKITARDVQKRILDTIGVFAA